MKITIFAQKIAQLLTCIVLVIVTASLVGQFSRYFLGRGNLLGLVHLFNINEEYNFPAWYSAFTLLICGVLLAIIALNKQLRKDRYTLHWKILSIIFVYLSLDEWFVIHETVNSSLNKLLQSAPNAYWDVLNSVFLITFLLSYAKFFFHLPKRSRYLFFIAGSLFVVGAVGVELIGVSYYPNLYHQPTFFSEIIATVEEFLEMMGIIVFIYALLSYMSMYMQDVKLSIVDLESSKTKALVAERIIPAGTSQKSLRDSE